MKHSLYNDLKAFFERNKDVWHSKAALTRLDWPNKKDRSVYSPENVGRRLRELEEDHIICVRYDANLNAEYRFIPVEWRDRYRDAKVRGPYVNTPMWAPAV